MRSVIKCLNILIVVLASCVLGLVLYGGLRQSEEMPNLAVTDENQIQMTSSEAIDTSNSKLNTDPWEQGTQFAEQGDWLQAVDYLESALEQEPEVPERYLLLAQAYRETERDANAAEVLRSGVESTGSEELELPLKAVETTLEMPEDQRNYLNSLYVAFQSGEESSVSAALQAWEGGRRVLHGEGHYTQNSLWVKTGNLAWDGERFWTDFTGTGLLFYGDSMFYGTIFEGNPNGTGSCVNIHTWYPDGAISYLRLDGQWQNGVAIGEVEFHDRCTNIADTFTKYDMTATLDGTTAEVITYGEVTMQFPVEGTIHTFQLSIRDGTLNQERFSNGIIYCSTHSGCGVHLVAEADSFSTNYRNPYPWAKESPYKEPWMFLNFSYGY